MCSHDTSWRSATTRLRPNRLIDAHDFGGSVGVRRVYAGFLPLGVSVKGVGECGCVGDLGGRDGQC
jgi:hypothetical protein